MSIARAGTPGATRVCPHCKAIVLESAAVCPGCRHHLRFSSSDTQLGLNEGYCAFNIEGTIAHKQSSEHCEYCIVLDIRNERGEQIIRQVVGVGALHPGELRRLGLTVEMLPVRSSVPKPEALRDARAINRPAVPAAVAAPAATAVAPARAPGPTPTFRAQPQPAARPAVVSSAVKPATAAPSTASSPKPTAEAVNDGSRIFRQP